MTGFAGVNHFGKKEYLEPRAPGETISVVQWTLIVGHFGSEKEMAHECTRIN